jgi:hypothetical protein
MKAFATFPTICVFIFVFNVIKNQYAIGIKKNLFWSLAMSLVFCGLVISILIIDKTSYFLVLLLVSNLVFALLLIPVLMFLINDCFPTATGATFWLRLFVSGIVSIAITGALLGASVIFALLNNPMDPMPT